MVRTQPGVAVFRRLAPGQTHKEHTPLQSIEDGNRRHFTAVLRALQARLGPLGEREAALTGYLVAVVFPRVQDPARSASGSGSAPTGSGPLFVLCLVQEIFVSSSANKKPGSFSRPGSWKVLGKKFYEVQASVFGVSVIASENHDGTRAPHRPESALII